ncbi:hypothetical protein AVJ23_17310 [Pseudoponticoccus marisrubri]|uniref:Uncharacterized protein n=1 Tax=Pseudoponticoccus marisrubri TaxID=1685382 RepID=A0A0W7WFP2_9RHOB|nr:hypothetical protein AVJ23_17310 [Pseudoponticoccus marisrubri]
MIAYLTRVHFADRVLEDALPEELSRLGLRHPLILTDIGNGESDGLDRLQDALAVTPEEPALLRVAASGDGTADLSRARALCAETGCDGIIGFGGMRALDLARLLADAQRPAITIPTQTQTIGLGPLSSHVVPAPGCRAVLPAAVLCDATLTLGADPDSTATAGMDALIHCLESFLGTAFNPPADGIALEGLRRCALHLEDAVRDGADITARRELLAVALNGGLAAEKGFGGIEAAAHGLETLSGARHGALHGALLGGMLSFNAPAVSDRFAVIRTALGLPARSDLAEELAALARRIGLPTRLSDIGIGADLLPAAARRAAADPANRTNPRLATARDYERIMRAAL